MSVLENVTLKPSVTKQKTLTGNDIFSLFFFSWTADFNFNFASIFQITLLSKLRKYNWTEKVERDRYNEF